MGKVSPKGCRFKTAKQRRELRSSGNKYLRPGALAQLRYSKNSMTRSCMDILKKRVAVINSKKARDDLVREEKSLDRSPLMLSPVNLVKRNDLHGTPETPRTEHFESESRLESLPMDLLIKILCHLRHDQLTPVFHVSQRIRNAVLIARQFHFNYTTPYRSRKEMLSTVTPRPAENWPFISKGDGKGMMISSPHTPKAPKHGPRPPSRLKVSEMRQIAAALFQESTFPPACMVPSVFPKPSCKTLASNRALFYEDELCEAVAQNKLL